ncbi:MAG: 3-isopropylmalate dehydrogenase [Hespellia sp.]|nr:3-isopropylmalate dehydrogenase [Hespellia sp.]
MAKEKKVQWHPAFAQTIQIEFEAEADSLEFEEEHLLGSKPMQIDVLIIKKVKDVQIKKNIGRIFRGHNVIEYKSPDDTFSINDFYKVYGYACFYQSDTERIAEISAEDLTITIVCNKYPRKLIHHLEQVRGITVIQCGEGIYYLEGDPIPIQLLITNRLSENENLWLRSLRTDIQSKEEINRICNAYEKHRHAKKYKAAMDAIMRGNWEKMKEAKEMCDALRELFAEEIEEVERRKEQEKEEEKEQEKQRLLSLISAMSADGKTDQIPMLSKDKAFLQAMLEKYEGK